MYHKNGSPNCNKSTKSSFYGKLLDLRHTTTQAHLVTNRSLVLSYSTELAITWRCGEVWKGPANTKNGAYRGGLEGPKTGPIGAL